MKKSNNKFCPIHGDPNELPHMVSHCTCENHEQQQRVFRVNDKEVTMEEWQAWRKKLDAAQRR